MAEEPGRERREHERFVVDLELELRTDEGPLAARAHDLSRGGICLSTPVPLAQGRRLEMALSLVLGEDAYSEPLVIGARVVWCTRLPKDEAYQIGAAFVDLTDETRDFLLMFLRFLHEGPAGDLGPEAD